MTWLLEVSSDALAEFNATDVRHSPVGDYQSRFVFGKKIQSLASVLRKEDGVALLRKRLLYQFAINRGIICDQNLQSAGSGIHSWASLFACDSCQVAIENYHKK